MKKNKMCKSGTTTTIIASSESCPELSRPFSECLNDIVNVIEFIVVVVAVLTAFLFLVAISVKDPPKALHLLCHLSQTHVPFFIGLLFGCLVTLLVGALLFCCFAVRKSQAHDLIVFINDCEK